MLKSYITCLHKAIHCILDDAMDALPCIHKELKRDQSRFASLARTRGLPTFTLDLPALGKHFDKCLSEGTYTKSNLPLSRGSGASATIPILLSGMLLRVFKPCGELRTGPCIQAITFLRQLYAIGKKVKLDCEERRVYETLDDFYKVDAQLPVPSLSWDRTSGATIALRRGDLTFSKYDPDRMFHLVGGHRCEGESRKDRLRRVRTSAQRALETMQQCADIVSSTLGDFDPLAYSPKHGPGAVSDLASTEYKYSFESWSESLEGVFPQSVFAFANYSSWVDSGGLKTVPPASKLICVPKTQKGPRLIACEPVAHQWCQQIIWKYLETGVSQSWIRNSISFRDQTKNQQWALSASRTSSHWTVDLSAASDRVTCRFVERMFRSNPKLLSALIATRTPDLRQEITGYHPEKLSIRKFSMMGSACTFPIQSISFLTIALASICQVRGLVPSIKTLKDLSKEVSVFGDDIIVPSDAGEMLERYLHHLSFKVNQAKTHRNGRFRESCGMEAYDGVDVTPAYILQVPTARKPETILSVVESSNNFYRKGYWRLAHYLQTTVNRRDIPVVSHNSGTFGFVTFASPPPPKRKRWNKDLHRWESRQTQVCVRSSHIPQEGNAVLLQYFTEDPDPSLPWRSGKYGRPRIKLRRGWADISNSGFTPGLPATIL